jgi:hypothetical protein
VWEMIVHIWVPLTMAYDPASTQLKVPIAVNTLVSSIYANKFYRSVNRASKSFADVCADIAKTPRMSPKIKASIPDEKRILTTVKNCNWMLQYWTCEVVPNPISDQFGYVQVDGRTNYQDLVQ